MSDLPPRWRVIVAVLSLLATTFLGGIAALARSDTRYLRRAEFEKHETWADDIVRARNEDIKTMRQDIATVKETVARLDERTVEILRRMQ